MIRQPSVWDMLQAQQAKPKLGGVWDAIGGGGNQVPLPGTGQQIELPAVMEPQAPQPASSISAIPQLPLDAGAPAIMPPVDTAPIKPVGNGIFDRIGDFIGSDEGKGALLRSGAATIQGGIGAGIAAGADWTDKRRMQKMQSDQFDQKHALDQQGVAIDQQRADSDALYKAGILEQKAVEAGIDVAKLNEAIRKNKSGEQLDALELQALDWYRKEQIRLGYAKEEGANYRTNVTQAGANARHAAPSGSTLATQAGADRRAMLPPAAVSTTSTVSENDDGVKTTTSSRASLPRVFTQEQYDALQPGTEYTDSLGQKVVKR